MSRQDRFLKACRREEVDATPVWLMRQAGRYMQEYRDLREKYSFLDMCKIPEVALEVTMQPVDKVGVDAAILFSDILIPVEAMGIDLEFTEGRGPVINNPVRDERTFNTLREIVPDDVAFVTDAIKIIRRELDGKVPLIGFSGAPFTLASYMVEGGHSRNFLTIKGMMYQASDLYKSLMDLIADVVITYLKAQIAAGAQTVQLFDSWVGCLGPDDYEMHAMPYTKKVTEALQGSGVPVIHFANGASTYLDKVAAAGGDVIGVDWRIDIDKARDVIGPGKAVQGNLDPVVLLSSQSEIEQRASRILKLAGGKPGHIFNLGHGVLPPTPVENVRFLIETVHNLSRKDVAADL